VCFVVHKTTSELERAILTTLYFVGAENTDSWHTMKGDLWHAIPLDVPMVHSSPLAVSTDSERLTCGGFTVSETVRFGSIEFIADCLGSLSLSPRRNDSSTAFMGSPRSEPPTPLRAMIDSTEEFFSATSGEGDPSSHLPEGTTRGLHLLPSQPRRGRRML
jgi:hypothetical protein